MGLRPCGAGQGPWTAGPFRPVRRDAPKPARPRRRSPEQLGVAGRFRADGRAVGSVRGEAEVDHALVMLDPKADHPEEQAFATGSGGKIAVGGCRGGGQGASPGRSGPSSSAGRSPGCVFLCGAAIARPAAGPCAVCRTKGRDRPGTAASRLPGRGRPAGAVLPRACEAPPARPAAPMPQSLRIARLRLKASAPSVQAAPDRR